MNLRLIAFATASLALGTLAQTSAFAGSAADTAANLGYSAAPYGYYTPSAPAPLRPLRPVYQAPVRKAKRARR